MTRRTNRQHGNVGNLGDILKHAALLALADAVRGAAGGRPVHYIETHAFLLHGDVADGAVWQREVADCVAARPAYDDYARVERSWVERGAYRCSSGLVVDRIPGVRLHLAEKDGAIRAALEAQLQHEGIVPAGIASDGRRFAPPSEGDAPGGVLALVDPFGDPEPFWASVSDAASSLRGGGDPAALLAFAHGGRPDWPDAFGGFGARVAVVDDAPYHLAAWASPEIEGQVADRLAGLGWVRDRA